MSATVSVVVVVLVAIFSSITAPLIISAQAEKRHREDRQADWDRQDKVAAAAKQTADDLAVSQKRIADQAAEAASLLLAANERVAHTAQVTNGKLDIIHQLVNSNMTAAMQAELDATVRELAMMREVIELKRAAGKEPTVEALAAETATMAKIGELTSTLQDRITNAPPQRDDPGQEGT